MERQTCIFGGQVQGVGFRYTVQNLALQYDVKGYVRNLSDGRVELVMEGPEGEMAALLEDIKRRMNGFIEDVQIGRLPGTGEFQRFCIKH
jgi:acylphosphatase